MPTSDLAYIMVDSVSYEMAGKVVIITNASTVLGLAIACGVLRKGGLPFLHDRSAEALVDRFKNKLIV